MLATERTIPLVDVAGLVARSGATTAEEVVDYFLTLLGPLDVGSASVPPSGRPSVATTVKPAVRSAAGSEHGRQEAGRTDGGRTASRWR